MKRRMIPITLLMILLSVLASAAQQPVVTPVPPGPTLNSIQSRGEVICGVSPDWLGFSYLDPNTGGVRGFNIDLCRALAAAVFGDATAVQLPLFTSRDEALDALRAGEVDVVMQDVVWTVSAEQPDLDFGPITFYSGQSMMSRAESTITGWPGLDGATVCVVEGGQPDLESAARARGVNLQLLPLPTAAEALDALADARCDALGGDRIKLQILRQGSDNPAGYQVWQDSAQFYTQEPYTPVYRDADDQWASIVDWTLLGLIAAEQMGISSETLDDFIRQPAETDADYIARVGQPVARFLDPTLGIGFSLGIPADFMLSVIREVGNYSEIYSRHLGAEGDLPIDRGLNALWQDGGLLYTPDWR